MRYATKHAAVAFYRMNRRPDLNAAKAFLGQVRKASEGEGEVADPSASAVNEWRRARVDEALESLSLRERKILELRFGLEDGNSRTRADVAREFKRDSRWVGRVESDALRKLREFEFPEPDETHEYSGAELLVPDTQVAIARVAPSVGILQSILADRIRLDDLDWRQFEELLGDLLEKDGYRVELGPGTKDGGKDLIAYKDIDQLGTFASVWQAKKLSPGNKVEVATIRELADVRQQFGANKGVIATTTCLTRGALERISQDKYSLHKLDRDDMLAWIAKLARR